MPLPKTEAPSNDKVFEITAPGTPILSNKGSVISDRNEKTKDSVSAFDETIPNSTLPTPVNNTTPNNASGQDFFSAQPRTSQEGGDRPQIQQENQSSIPNEDI